MYRLTLFLLLISFSTFSQIIPNGEPIPDDEEEPQVELKKQKPAWTENLQYGGNVWLGFWGDLYVEATPMVGMKLNDKGTVAGIGATISYNGSNKIYGGGMSFGPRAFVRQKIWNTVFAHAEYELINSSPYNFYDYEIPQSGIDLDPKNKWGSSAYVGGGFYQGIKGGQGGAFISLLYNLLPNSGYVNPQAITRDGRLILRVGFFI